MCHVKFIEMVEVIFVMLACEFKKDTKHFTGSTVLTTNYKVCIYCTHITAMIEITLHRSFYNLMGKIG